MSASVALEKWQLSICCRTALYTENKEGTHGHHPIPIQTKLYGNVYNQKQATAFFKDILLEVWECLKKKKKSHITRNKESIKGEHIFKMLGTSSLQQVHWYSSLLCFGGRISGRVSSKDLYHIGTAKVSIKSIDFSLRSHITISCDNKVNF